MTSLTYTAQAEEILPEKKGMLLDLRQRNLASALAQGLIDWFQYLDMVRKLEE